MIWKLFAIGGILLVVGLGLVSAEVITSTQLLSFSVLGIPLSTAYVSNRMATFAVHDIWGQAAENLGLDCRLIGEPFANTIIIDGERNNRAVVVSVQGYGKARVMTSRIELKLNIDTPIALRIWGPAEGQQEDIDQNLYEATDSQRRGIETPFFLRSTPKRLGDYLYRESAWDELRSFTRLTNIQTDGSTLFLEQSGIWIKADAISSMVNTLEAFADSIESWESQMMLWQELKASPK